MKKSGVILFGIKGACALMLLLFCGCVRSGGLYRNVVTPYSKNFKNTPAGLKCCAIKAHKLKEPISGYGITAEWDTSYLAGAMKKANMTKVHYMDLHTFSILFDIYSRKQILVYGE